MSPKPLSKSTLQVRRLGWAARDGELLEGEMTVCLRRCLCIRCFLCFRQLRLHAPSPRAVLFWLGCRPKTAVSLWEYISTLVKDEVTQLHESLLPLTKYVNMRSFLRQRVTL
jgi:hypothetical protein